MLQPILTSCCNRRLESLSGGPNHQRIRVVIVDTWSFGYWWRWKRHFILLQGEKFHPLLVIRCEGWRLRLQTNQGEHFDDLLKRQRDRLRNPYLSCMSWRNPVAACRNLGRSMVGMPGHYNPLSFRLALISSAVVFLGNWTDLPKTVHYMLLSQ
jgi:hypothetical protein